MNDIELVRFAIKSLEKQVKDGDKIFAKREKKHKQNQMKYVGQLDALKSKLEDLEATKG